MGFLRDTKAKRSLYILLSICALAVFAAFILDVRFGVLTLLLCAVFTVFFLLTEKERYACISELASDVEKILHGETEVSFDKYSEGELSILQTEISRMTVCLIDQKQRLYKDKQMLADSLADISHQIRTPLTSINLLVSLLSEEGISAERRKKLTRDLFDLLSRIDWLISALLKCSRLDAGTVVFKKEISPVSELISEACAPLLIPMELKGISLVTNTDGSFCADFAWTCEAVSNIIKNCMEHTQSGGEIRITAFENAIYSEIKIRDNGGGIPEEDLPHVFERFYKGKNSGEKGFGIGLALSRMIIMSQNGSVKAENDGQGAVFTIKLYKGTV